ncbi:DNA endonuclease V [Marssonina coronariae]|uniref:DNA endonuclease V n=1 Tax=Diplocarpon coronariae TaxID=2795749 RepID=A0A218YZ53_9HELO|nr:DNA endonuclease V [Marssonina coronariae]
MLHAAVPFATFDIIWWWVGLGLPTGEYTLYGKNKKCYNFPGLFAYPTGSPISESPLLPTPIIPFSSPGCWVYRAANCLGGEDGIFTGVGSEGYQIYDGDSQSLICAKST